MRAIDRKVLRDVAGLRGQLLAIALVVGAGVGLFLAMQTCLRSLQSAQQGYYHGERFGDVFAGLVRAPEHVADQLRAIPGVHTLQTRVIARATLDLPGVTQAVSGRLVSIPDEGRATVNALRLRSGRLPAPERSDEIVVNEGFAEAHAMPLGTEIGAVIDGKHQRLRVVGTALSPEFIYVLGPGSIFPDDRLYGILWMRRATLGPAFDMEGAFNDVSLRLTRGTGTEGVIRRVDDILDRYGGSGAYARKDQQSHFFLNSELEQLRSFGMMVPIMFLLAAAFLLNVVVGRIIAGQRGQIASLKALGYHDGEVGAHYAKLVGVVVAAGYAIGLAVATWIGSAMIEMYAKYYRLPDLQFDMGFAEAVQVATICFVAAGLGTWAAIRRTVSLPPAEAMRPEAPAVYRRTVLERLGLTRLVPASTAMVLREMERKPFRRLLTFAGMSMATALVVVSTFAIDAIDYAMLVSFGLERREDVQLTLMEPRASGTLTELEHLPGVQHAEPFRSVPVRMHNGHRVRNVAILGIPQDATLQQILDVKLRTIPLPEEGLVLTRKLAEILDAQVGDVLRFDVLEGHRASHSARVSRIAETFVGLGAYMELHALCRVLREPLAFSGAWLTVDDEQLPALHQKVKRTPAIAGISSRDDAMRTYRKLIDENLGMSISISVGFALIMALGILYNAARITLAEHARQLASLRVLGYRRSEVAKILLGELAFLTALAIPAGMVLGYLLAMLTVVGFDTEQLRIPLVVQPRTYALAGVTVLAATLVSGWAAWRKLDKMDIIEVLKIQE